MKRSAGEKKKSILNGSWDAGVAGVRAERGSIGRVGAGGERSWEKGVSSTESLPEGGAKSEGRMGPGPLGQT